MSYRGEGAGLAAESRFALRGAQPVALQDVNGESVQKLRCPRHPIALQNVVAERVQQNGRSDLFEATHSQADQIPIAPAGVDAFADAAFLILRLSLLARHAFAPSRDAGAVLITGREWVLCHEYRRSKRRCVTVREMKEGPSSSAIRC